jgi:hypothetical protein
LKQAFSMTRGWDTRRNGFRVAEAQTTLALQQLLQHSISGVLSQMVSSMMQGLHTDKTLKIAQMFCVKFHGEPLDKTPQSKCLQSLNLWALVLSHTSTTQPAITGCLPLAPADVKHL